MEHLTNLQLLAAANHHAAQLADIIVPWACGLTVVAAILGKLYKEH